MPISYSGNPDNNPTAVQLPSGGDAPSSALFQTAYEGDIDREQYAQCHGDLSALVNMLATFTWNASTGGPFAVTWDDTLFTTDPANGESWIVCGYDGSSKIKVFTGLGTDGASSWSEFGADVTSSAPAITTTVDSAGVIWIATIGGTGTGLIDWWLYPLGGPVWLHTAASGSATATDVQFAAVGANVVGAFGDSTAGNAFIAKFIGGGTFTGASGLSVQHWIVRSNGAYALCIPKDANKNIAYKTVDGTTSVTSSAIGLASPTTDVPLDLTWSPSRSLWLLTVDNGGAGTTTTFYTSPDGVTWTKVVPSPTAYIANVVAVGAVFFGLIVNAAASPEPTARLVSSFNGAVSWRVHPLRVAVTSSFDRFRLFASPCQLLMTEIVVPTSSGQAGHMRFTNPSGQGDRTLT